MSRNSMTWTPQMLQAYQERQAKLNKADEPKKSKYGNVKTEVGGIKFDSQAEAARYLVLKQMERVGDITDLELQVSYEIVPSVTIRGKKVRPKHYVADFRYRKDGVVVVEDVKGMLTKEYLLKRQLMKHVHDIEILET